jgi:folate-binding protein YgfZ
MTDAAPDAPTTPDGYRSVRAGATWAAPQRDRVSVTGPDAVTYLQGQLSQDIAGLAVGESAWTLLLDPSGKLGSWLRVTRTADDSFVLDGDPGSGASVVARLNRFKLRTAAEIEQLDRSAPVPDAGVEAPADASEAERIEAGVPKLGAELVDDVIPAELGQWLIATSVSFTKGCYTGQELVARIDSRGGNVPRHLRGLVVDGDVVPAVGAEIFLGEKLVGTITSSARSSLLGAPVALAFVHRTVDPPAPVEVRWPGGTATAEVRELPLTAGS